MYSLYTQQRRLPFEARTVAVLLLARHTANRADDVAARAAAETDAAGQGRAG